MPFPPFMLAGAAGIGLIAAAMASASAADPETGDRTMPEALTAEPASSPAAAWMPPAYRGIARRDVTVDGERAELVRYERGDGRNAGMGGEHFSTVIDAGGRLRGFARMDLDLVGGALPSPEEAREIAMAFLREAAPDLLPTVRISWIDRHDEPLRVTLDGRRQDLTLTGMKVKMRNTADGRWFWVIVGSDRKVTVFEREIVWVTFPGHRKTEKWLHDAWLVENGHAS